LSRAISISGAHTNGVTLDFSRPGQPADDGYIEAFNGRFRAEWLNAHWFVTLDTARSKLEDSWNARTGRSGTKPRLRCSIAMALLARRRDKAGKL
jgi:transposase InsO family protein